MVITLYAIWRKIDNSNPNNNTNTNNDPNNNTNTNNDPNNNTNTNNNTNNDPNNNTNTNNNTNNNTNTNNTPKLYSIIYVLYGGVNSIVAPITYDGSQDVNLPEPTRNGYDFKGWYLEATYATKITKIDKGTNKDIFIYARWEESPQVITYTIQYNLGGGTNPSNAPTTYQTGTSFALPIPERNGYTFDGWYKESGYINKVTEISATSIGNLVLFAKWLENDNGIRTITYILNGGTNPANAPTQYTKGTGLATLPTPTRSNSTFLGWYEYKNGSEIKVTSIGTDRTDNIVLYAKWESTTKRSYNYSFYTENTSNTYHNKDDLKRILFTIMNNGAFDTTIFCDYTNCVNDFLNMIQEDTKEEMSSIVNYVNPFNAYKSISYSYNSNTINLKFNKKYDDATQAQLNAEIDNLISTNGVNQMTVEQKIKWAHDYLVNRNSYDLDAAANPSSNPNAFSAVGSLLQNKAVCQGYAEAMALILDRFNIPNLSVSSLNHIWNLIYINGQWLHLDATWDDPVTSNGSQVLRYTYYLKTSAELKQIDAQSNKTDHVYNASYYLETN